MWVLIIALLLMFVMFRVTSYMSLKNKELYQLIQHMFAEYAPYAENNDLLIKSRLQRDEEEEAYAYAQERSDMLDEFEHMSNNYMKTLWVCIRSDYSTLYCLRKLYPKLTILMPPK